jgi:hypothetical protein
VFAEKLRELRQGNDNPFDLIVEIAPDEDPEPWEDAGATWVLTGSSDQSPKLAEVRAVIEAGPR